MENLEKYRQGIQQLLTEYANRRNSIDDDVEAHTIFDEKQDRYLLTYIGWNHQRQQRIFGIVLYFHIRDDKIWLEWNGTEDDVTEPLLNMGISKKSLVIGFHAPHVRKYTEYALG